MDTEERFNEIYQKIVEENASEMEELRIAAQKEKKYNSKIGKTIVIIDILITIILFITYANDFIPEFLFDFFSFIMLIVSIVIYEKKSDNSKTHKFERKFKNVMNTLIKAFNQKLEYIPEPKYHPDFYKVCKKLESDYKKAKFDNYDEFQLDDLIKGKLKNNSEIIISDVLTQSVSEDSEGHTYTNPIFIGLFARMETPKPFNSSLYLRNDREKKVFSEIDHSATLSFDELKIQLDFEEFEKVFDVYASDKIIAMQILTADIMQDLLQFYKELGIKYELTIKENCIYIRFWSRAMFEVAQLDKFSLDRDTLYKYYRILEFTFSISDKLIKVLDETQY